MYLGIGFEASIVWQKSIRTKAATRTKQQQEQQKQHQQKQHHQQKQQHQQKQHQHKQRQYMQQDEEDDRCKSGETWHSMLQMKEKMTMVATMVSCVQVAGEMKTSLMLKTASNKMS